MARPKTKDKTIHATMLPGTNLTTDKIRVARDPDEKQNLIGAAELLAKSKLCNRAWPYKNARRHFPVSPMMWTVDRYFPWAEGGALYVDEPDSEQSVSDCKLKAQALKEEGLRYVYITRDLEGIELVNEVRV